MQNQKLKDSSKKKAISQIKSWQEDRHNERYEATFSAQCLNLRHLKIKPTSGHLVTELSL